MEAVAKVHPAQAVAAHHLHISNAITPEREYMRRSLLPSILEALAIGQRERGRVQLFEVGRVYLPRTTPRPDAGDEAWLPDEPRRLALAMAGPRTTLAWRDSLAEPLDFFNLKGVIEVLLARLGLEGQAVLEPLTNDERLHPGRAATLAVALPPANGKGQGEAVPLGVLGELHPAVVERLEIDAPRVVVAELDLDALTALVQPRYYRPISRYPANVQDIAVVVADNVPASQVEAAIRRGAGDMLEALTLFDIYTGAQVGEGKRSLAYRLAFRAPDRTLNDEALTRVRAKIVRLLEREVGAAIRG
jgi:phenylalanyl-tRNA synthetase beta chain